MKKYNSNMLEHIRRYIFIISASFVAGATWGFLSAMVISHVLYISEDTALLYVGIPVAIILFLVVFKHFQKNSEF